MVKVLASADWHLGLSRHSPSSDPSMRLRDAEAIGHRFVDAAIENAVDLAVLAGDTFHSRNPKPPELAAAGRILRRLADADIPTVIVGGNHDGPSTVGDASSHTLGWIDAVALPGVEVFLQADRRIVATLAGPVSVVGVPYPHQRGFDQLRSDMTPTERMEEIGRFLSDTIEGMAQGDDPRLLVGHLSVAGSSLGSERMLRFGWDTTISIDAFRDYDVALLGHIHVQQNVGPRAYYAGAPSYVDFGEVGQKKGFLLVEVERGRDPVVTVIDSKPRPMVVVDYADVGATYDAPEGAIVRATKPRDKLMVVNNAAFVEFVVAVEEAAPVTEDRPSIAPDASIEDALKHWFAINGHPEEPALSRARDLFNA
jgi:exonuclease SbcD